jgi:hypothetical protein
MANISKEKHQVACLLREFDNLTDWEKDFAISLNETLKRRALSDKQASTLNKIYIALDFQGTNEAWSSWLARATSSSVISQIEYGGTKWEAKREFAEYERQLEEEAYMNKMRRDEV